MKACTMKEFLRGKELEFSVWNFLMGPVRQNRLLETLQKLLKTFLLRVRELLFIAERVLAEQGH